MAISHAGHNHPSTPAARSACRKQMANGDTPLTGNPIPVSLAGVLARTITPEIRMTGPVARRMAKYAVKAERIQPRRGGARVSAGASTCVQAALHTGTGRCACGWHAADHCKTEVWACAGH